jgi:hypothetical protein
LRELTRVERWLSRKFPVKTITPWSTTAARHEPSHLNRARNTFLSLTLCETFFLLGVQRKASAGSLATVWLRAPPHRATKKWERVEPSGRLRHQRRSNFFMPRRKCGLSSSAGCTTARLSFESPIAPMEFC